MGFKAKKLVGSLVLKLNIYNNYNSKKYTLKIQNAGFNSMKPLEVFLFPPGSSKFAATHL